MSVTFPGNTNERRAFHYFQVRTVPAFAGSSEIAFWHNLVLKVGQQEPVIRNAIVALGTLHEDYQKRRGQYSQDLVNDPSHQEALSLYGRAIRQLNQKLSEPNSTSAKLAIICSILFTCFEVLRRNNMTGLIHYQAGLREIIRQIDNTRQEDATAGQFASAVTEFRSIPQDELDVLHRVLVRYDVQACTFAKPRAQALAIKLAPQPPAFHTLDDVKFHLDNLLISVYQLIKSDLSLYRYWRTELIPTARILQRDNAITTFEAWLAAIEDFFHTITPSQPSTSPSSTLALTLTPHERKTLLGLRFHVKTALISLKTSIDSGPEMCFDAFLPDFLDIVTRTEELADSLSLHEAEPLEPDSADFTMDFGILPPLFFVATKCRVWGVRRRAISALRRGGREGVWEGPVMAVVANRVREIEEQGLHEGQVVPELNRVHNVRSDVDYESRSVMVECRRCVDLVEWKEWEVIRERVRF